MTKLSSFEEFSPHFIADGGESDPFSISGYTYAGHITVCLYVEEERCQGWEYVLVLYCGVM